MSRLFYIGVSLARLPQVAKISLRLPLTMTKPTYQSTPTRTRNPTLVPLSQSSVSSVLRPLVRLATSSLTTEVLCLSGKVNHMVSFLLESTPRTASPTTSVFTPLPPPGKFKNIAALFYWVERRQESTDWCMCILLMICIMYVQLWWWHEGPNRLLVCPPCHLLVPWTQGWGSRQEGRKYIHTWFPLFWVLF